MDNHLLKVMHSPDAEHEFHFKCVPRTAARKTALDAMRTWHNIAQLVAFAESRHGYQDTDGFFGITYPADLDEFDRASGSMIPQNHVEVNAWYGARDGTTYLLPEHEYLELLRQFLALNNRSGLASRIQKLLSEYEADES